MKDLAAVIATFIVLGIFMYLTYKYLPEDPEEFKVLESPITTSNK